jgi:hypothetical protein
MAQNDVEDGTIWHSLKENAGQTRTAVGAEFGILAVHGDGRAVA